MEEEIQRRSCACSQFPPCLAHEAGDDAVEGGGLEAEPLLAGAERAEVLCSDVAEGEGQHALYLVSPCQKLSL